MSTVIRYLTIDLIFPLSYRTLIQAFPRWLLIRDKQPRKQANKQRIPTSCDFFDWLQKFLVRKCLTEHVRSTERYCDIPLGQILRQGDGYWRPSRVLGGNYGGACPTEEFYCFVKKPWGFQEVCPTEGLCPRECGVKIAIAEFRWGTRIWDHWLIPICSQ